MHKINVSTCSQTVYCLIIQEADAMEHVFGYTVANDLTARDMVSATKNGGQFLLAKSMDNFCPLFSDIVTKVNSFSFILFYVSQRIEVTWFRS